MSFELDNKLLNQVRETCLNYIIRVVASEENQTLALSDEIAVLPFVENTGLSSVRVEVPYDYAPHIDRLTDEYLFVYYGSMSYQGYQLSTDDLLVLADAIYRLVTA